MPADPSVAKNFLLTTDYPIDQLIYLGSGSFDLGAYPSIVTTTFAHNLNYMPLIDLVWSTDEDFSTSYMSDSGPPPFDSQRFQLGVRTTINATDTDISITTFNFLDNPITFYYRVYGFERSGTEASFEPTADASDPFTINTDYNYPKLYINGSNPLPGSPTVTHDLGYIPQVEGWVELPPVPPSPPFPAVPRRIQPVEVFSNNIYSSTFVPLPNSGYIVTPSQFTINTIDGSPDFSHYRIYLDEVETA